MRVPRNLLPFILPENINKLFLSTYAHSNVEMDIKSDTSIPSNSNDEMDQLQIYLHTQMMKWKLQTV